MRNGKIVKYPPDFFILVSSTHPTPDPLSFLLFLSVVLSSQYPSHCFYPHPFSLNVTIDHHHWPFCCRRPSAFFFFPHPPPHSSHPLLNRPHSALSIILTSSNPLPLPTHTHPPFFSPPLIWVALEKIVMVWKGEGWIKKISGGREMRRIGSEREGGGVISIWWLY